MSDSAIFCLALSRGRADRTIHDLKDADYLDTQISVLFFDRIGESETSGAGRASQITAAAAQSAGAIRGVICWIAGISRLTVPGVGAFIAAGPIIKALQEARNGAPGVAIARALVALGVPVVAATRYERCVKAEGRFLVAVHTTDAQKILRAREIFSRAQAEDIVTAADASPVVEA